MTLKTLCAYAAAILLANTAYIAAAASPTVFYMGNVLAHVVLGAVVWVAALGLLATDRELRRRPSTRPSPQADSDSLRTGRDMQSRSPRSRWRRPSRWNSYGEETSSS